MFASNYLLNQADIGMGCALGTGGGMVQSLVAAYAPADVRRSMCWASSSPANGRARRRSC